MSVIEVENLQKRYGQIVAVEDVSFEVEAGEVFCLLGPNGAGKTTTTEVLEGYRTRSGGRVSVLGFDPQAGDRRYRRRIGIVLQECGVQDDLTVAEVLDLYGGYYPKRRSIDEVIELVELDAKTSDRVRHLSGGQRRRLDIGLAIIGCPDVIFLDEPTTGFDPAARRNSWSMIRSLTRLGTTVLLTTHFMDEAQALADRIAVVAGGRIVATGTPDTLGGRAEARTVIEATLPPNIAATDLPSLDGTAVRLESGRLHVECRDAVTVTHRLTGWSLERGVALGNLRVAQPSLEDVYLSLTNDLTDRRTKEHAR